jgi:lipopolysaccharide heptosyltransferase I
LQKPTRVLIIRPSSLGDVIRTVPALVSLRRTFPQARIDWVVNDSFASAVQHHPDLSGVVAFPRGALGLELGGGKLNGSLAWARRNLREPAYDLVVDYQGLLRSGLMTRLTKAPRRIGYADAREMGWLGYTQRVRVPSRHHVDRVLELTRAVTGAEPLCDLRLYADPKDREALERDPELAGKRYVLLAPTTRGLGRAWPVERYSDLALHLLTRRKELGIDSIVVTGMANEREYCEPVLDQTRTILETADLLPQLGGKGEGVPAGLLVDRVGKTSISGLMALIERASLVVCNDSAAMHMAVAFDRPLVALLGASDVEHAGPYKRQRDVIQHKKPGERVRHRDVAAASELMRRISVDEVAAACEVRLKAKDL